MIRIIFLFLLLSACYHLNAQVVTISEEVSFRNDDNYEIIGKLGGNYLVFQDKETSFKVQSYDKNMRMNWDKELELDKRRPSFMGVDTQDSTFYLVYEFRNRGHTMVKVHRYDERANLVDSTLIKDYGLQYIAPNFQIIRSEDRSKILIFYVENYSTVNALCFDLNTMQTVWDNAFEPKNYGLSRENTQVLLSDDGIMYFVIQKNNFRSRTKRHYYEIYQIYEEAVTPALRTIAFPEEKLTFDVYFNYDNLNQQLVGGGLYASKNLVWAEGVFLMNIPKTSTDSALVSFSSFDHELMRNYLDKDAPRKLKGLFECEIQEVVMRSDGGLIMIVERVKSNQRTYGTTSAYAASSQLGIMTDLYFENLLVCSVNPDGSLDWSNVLRKKQFSQDDMGIYSSYYLMKTPKSLHVIFNDEIKDENNVSEYIIKGNGAAERNSVMSTDQQKLRLRFQDSVQISAEELLVPSQRRNRLKLVRISF